MQQSYKWLLVGIFTLILSASLAIVWTLYLFPKKSDRIPQSTSVYQKALLSIEVLNNHIQQDTCPCNLIEFPKQDFETEPVQTCRFERLSNESLFKQLPTQFTTDRARGAFPKECLTFIMKRFGPQNQKSSLFAHCSPNHLKASRNAFKPCVTDQYVNVTYNVFNDLSTCMGINPKFLIPKIATESGFHVNAFGANFDTGIGQLTGPAIEHVNYNFRTYQNHVLNSDRESCKRMRPLLVNQNPVSHGINSRCSLIKAPQNPALNLFYLFVKFQLDYLTLDQLLDRIKLNNLIAQAGMPQVDRDKLRVILLNLAYNTGAGGAVNHLREYIHYRIQLKAQGSRSLSTQDFDISSSLKNPNPNSHPLSFSQYLMLYQRVGTKGYLSKLKSKADELDRAFYPGACTFENYLQVSSGAAR
jgi:hypothetical protein